MTDASNLSRVNILSGLSNKELEDITWRLTPVNLSKGSYLFYRNDESTGLYMVCEGSLQIIIDNDVSREIIVYTIGSGDIVGEMTIFKRKIRSATAVALSDSKLYKISGEKFIDVMRLYPTIAINLSRILIDRLLSADEMIERLGAMDGTERVIHYLKALVIRDGVMENDIYRLDDRPTYLQISQRLGISEKTIYRTMRTLAKNGDIELRGRKLIMKTSFLHVH
ncbi:hypothetical protein MNBD_NITROSPINAE04-1363 [hydrothermal vent metagenome]|uniref:Cyclic nucleotide-binding domain-containing protein n=1 Tax=hydrothermal vent metagenome TaxID=652676 RepID=A0A3B1B9D2_9ZZZZ